MPTEKRKQRLIKAFYAPLKKFGVSIKFGDLLEIAVHVTKIDTKERHQHKKDRAARDRIKKQADNTLEAIKLGPVDDQVEP